MSSYERNCVAIDVVFVSTSFAVFVSFYVTKKSDVSSKCHVSDQDSTRDDWDQDEEFDVKLSWNDFGNLSE